MPYFVGSVFIIGSASALAAPRVQGPPNVLEVEEM